MKRTYKIPLAILLGLLIVVAALCEVLFICSGGLVLLVEVQERLSDYPDQALITYTFPIAILALMLEVFYVKIFLVNKIVRWAKEKK